MSTTPDRGRTAKRPGGIPVSGWKDVALRVKDQYSEDHVTLTGAGVAFFGFFALGPLLAATVSIYGLIADPADITSIVDDLRAAAPGEVANLVEQQLQSLSESNASALGIAALISIFVSLWSASSGFGHLMEAINIAYDEDTDDRPFWRRRLIAIGFTVGFLALVGAAAFLLRTLAGGLAFVAWIAVGAAVVVGLGVLYRYGPDRSDAKWEWVTPGAIFAVMGGLAVSIGFRYYVKFFGSYNDTYGAIGSIIIVLTWLYLSAVIVIVGAEINTELERQTLSDSTTGEPEPIGWRGAAAADDVAAAAANDVAAATANDVAAR